MRRCHSGIPTGYRAISSGFTGLRLARPSLSRSRCRISRPSARARLKAAGLRGNP